jgi:hypothetical protein
MKLSLLHEFSGSPEDILDASGIRPFSKGAAGPFNQRMPSGDTGSSKKKMQDPNYPERLTSAAASGNRSPEAKMLPLRSGNQDTPLKPRHELFFNSPSSGRRKKGGFKRHGKPLGSWPPAEREAPIGAWGKRPGVKDI